MLPHRAAETGHDDRTELPHSPYSFICISLTDDVSSPGYIASNDLIEQNGWKG